MPAASRRQTLLAAVEEALPAVPTEHLEAIIGAFADSFEAGVCDSMALESADVQLPFVDDVVGEMARQRVPLGVPEAVKVAATMFDWFDASAVNEAIRKRERTPSRAKNVPFRAATSPFQAGPALTFARGSDGGALAQSVLAPHLKARIVDLRPLGPLEGLGSIDALTAMSTLHVKLAPTCDLTPLTACRKLRVLTLGGKIEGFEPLSRLSSLTSLACEGPITGETFRGALNQRGVNEVADLKRLASLEAHVDPEADLRPLAKLKKLTRLQLCSPGRTADEATQTAVRSLAERGVYMCFYEHEGWPTKLDVPKRISHGFVVVNA
jgi:hypothetical protein